MISRQFVEELVAGVTSIDSLYENIRGVFKMGLEELLSAELDVELGYDRYERSQKTGGNSRNGYHKPKVVRSEFGEIAIRAPRDRDGVFEPKILGSYKREAGNFESKIISLYSSGNSLLDIKRHIRDLYGVDISPAFISKITDRIMPEIELWKSRRLQPIYPFIFMDAVNFNVRVDGHVNMHAVYVIIGITISGEKEILGFWIGEHESAAHWAGVLNEIKSRGVEDILLFCADGLSGLKEAIRTVYPGAVLQRCIVHQLRNTFKNFSYRNLKEVAADMKRVYRAKDEEEGFANLNEVSEKWGPKYAPAFASWFDNWDVLSPFFQYPAEVRKIVYTTNIIEGLNRQYRRVTKRKNMFPNERALEKMLYLSSIYITERWRKYENWDRVLSQLKLMFPGRLVSI